MWRSFILGCYTKNVGSGPTPSTGGLVDVGMWGWMAYGNSYRFYSGGTSVQTTPRSLRIVFCCCFIVTISKMFNHSESINLEKKPTTKRL